LSRTRPRPPGAAGRRAAARRCAGALAACLWLAACETLPGPDVASAPRPAPPPADPSAPAAVTAPAPDAGTGAPAPDAGFYAPGTGRFTARPGERGAKTVAGGEITLNFEDTDVAEVVSVILGDLLGENYLLDPEVAGGVTLQTSRPLPRDALIPTLEMLLRANGAALVRSDDLYHVVPRESATPGLVTPQIGDSSAPLPAGYSVRIVPLRYIGAAEMRTILEPFSTASNLVRTDTQRNLLILAGTGRELRRLMETIDIFDVDWLEGMSVALFTPTFVDAPTLAEELANLFGEGSGTPLAGLARLVPIERLNALLVITPRPELLAQVREWVGRLDGESGGVGRRLFVYHVQNGKAVEIAEVLSQVFGEEERDVPPLPELAPGLEPAELAPATEPAQGDGAGEGAAPAPAASAGPGSAEGLAIDESQPVRIIADEVNNALLVMATPAQFKQVQSALRSLDIVPLQVLIEATIAEITLTGELSQGLEWFFENDIGDGEGTATLDLGADGIAALTPGFSYAITDAAGAVRAVLNFLESDSRLNVISSPSLMVLNNQTAIIQVGDQVPITTQQQQATVADSTIVNSIEFRDTGVLLTVTPRVNAGGLVIMEIAQEVSDVAPGTADSLTPTIQQRKIESTVAVQSGQTVVLGGLIRENKSQTRSGIPGLYKVPILGPLFGQSLDERRRTELVVLITPRAVADSAQARQITEEFRGRMESLKPLTADF